MPFAVWVLIGCVDLACPSGPSASESPGFAGQFRNAHAQTVWQLGKGRFWPITAMGLPGSLGQVG